MGLCSSEQRSRSEPTPKRFGGGLSLRSSVLVAVYRPSGAPAPTGLSPTWCRQFDEAA